MYTMQFIESSLSLQVQTTKSLLVKFRVFLNKFAGDSDSVALTRARLVPSSEMAQIVASFGITSRENSRSERSAASIGMFDGVKCSDTLSIPPTMSL
jgi:hypothetical protein